MFPMFENLRAFFNNRPPLVVFMICLASFAIALITLAYFVKTKEIPDPDITRDWNSFFEKFSKIDLCFSQNASENVIVNSTGGRMTTGDLSPSELYHTLHEKLKQVDLYQTIKVHKLTTRDVRSKAEPKVVSVSSTKPASGKKETVFATSKPSPTPSVSEGLRNISFVLNVEVFLPKHKTTQFSLSDTNFVTVIGGDKLKMKGHLADSVLMASFSFHSNLSSDTCQVWDKGVCRKHWILACVQLQGPSSMFPDTPMPEQSEMCQTHHAAGEDNLGLRFMVPSLPSEKGKTAMCYQGSHMSTYFSFDESLTVFMSLHDRSIINLRLMRTSYFLFVMVVTFLCYAMIRGRRGTKNKSSIPYVEKVPSSA